MFISLVCAAAYGQRATVYTGMVSGDGVVKNAPFSAEAVSESIQVLADGNRIVRNTTSKIYRNSEGRVRREMRNSSGNVLGTTYYASPAITISDPVLRQRYMLDQELKVARATGLGSLPSVRVVTVPSGEANSDEEAEKRRQVELYAGREALRRAETNSKLAEEVVIAAGSIPRSGVLTIHPATNAKYETRTEELGSRTVEGVEAEGTRTYTTIPEGAIGNERPIEIVYERWYSKELQMTVYSRHTDPRFGEQTYRLTNIVRSEPDPSLFTIPKEYKIETDPGSAYRIRSVQDAQRRAVEAKAAGNASRPRP